MTGPFCKRKLGIVENYFVISFSCFLLDFCSGSEISFPKASCSSQHWFPRFFSSAARLDHEKNGKEMNYRESKNILASEIRYWLSCDAFHPDRNPKTRPERQEKFVQKTLIS
jgi:hypothetical protein